MKLDSYLSLHKFQWYRDERSQHETSLPKSDRENLEYTWANKHRKVLSEQDFISIAITTKNSKLYFTKVKHFHAAKDTINWVKKQPTKWEKCQQLHIWKGFVCRIYRTLITDREKKSFWIGIAFQTWTLANCLSSEQRQVSDYVFTVTGPTSFHIRTTSHTHTHPHKYTHAHLFYSHRNKAW